MLIYNTASNTVLSGSTSNYTICNSMDDRITIICGSGDDMIIGSYWSSYPDGDNGNESIYGANNSTTIRNGNDDKFALRKYLQKIDAKFKVQLDRCRREFTNAPRQRRHLIRKPRRHGR